MPDIVTNPITFTGAQELDLSTATFTPGAALALDSAAQIIKAVREGEAREAKSPQAS